MDLTYRFRYIFYFAAFMLVMSVCFLYAEPSSPSHLLFDVSPQHSGFLTATTPQPSFDPAALRTAVAPSVTPETLERILSQAHSRSLLHRGRRLPLQIGPVLQRNESSMLPVSPASSEGSAQQ